MIPPAIEIRGLIHRFGDVKALDGVELAVQGPGVFGFLGVNGAGKSTTMRILNGFIRPDAGEVRIRGFEVRPESLGVRAHLGYLPQTPAFPGWMTGREVLLFTAELAGLSSRESRTQADRLLEALDLVAAGRRRASGYSGGMRQRLGLAQALVGHPDLLLLDEPVSALDPVGRAQVLALIEELGQKATVFMSSHILADVERVCARVSIIHRGRIMADEATDSLRARYLQPVFDLDVTRPVEPLMKTLNGADFVEHVSLVPDEPSNATATLRIRVRDVDRAARALPGLVATAGLGLHRLQQASPSLEEAFLHIIDPAEKLP